MFIFKKTKHKTEIILKCIRLYLSYPLSYREIEELMLEEGFDVDHSTINYWVLKYTPKILKKFQKTKKKVGRSWKMDGTYIKVAGEWFYLYRAVDKENQTIDFYFSKRRNTTVVFKFLKQAIKNNGLPEVINIDKSGANKAGIERYNQRFGTNIEIRQSKYMNNGVEQDHRKIKRLTKSLGSFKSFLGAQISLAGMEMMNMLKKSQSHTGSLFSLSYMDDFYELARM